MIGYHRLPGASRTYRRYRRPADCGEIWATEGRTW